MPLLLRRLCTVLLAAALFALPSSAHAKRRWRLFHSPNADDVAVVPGNLSAGAGASGDVTGAHWGPTVTAELFGATWRRLSWTGVEMRLLFYRECDDCEVEADHFIGPRVGVVLASDPKRRHVLTLGAGAGWGIVAPDWGGRDRTAHGMVVSPNLRYTAFGLIGVEVAALAPAYRTGGRYPAAVTFNIVGGLLALAALSNAH